MGRSARGRCCAFHMTRVYKFQLFVIPPKRSLWGVYIGVIRWSVGLSVSGWVGRWVGWLVSMGGWVAGSVGRLVGRSVGRSVGPTVRCIFLVRSITWRLMVGIQFNFIQWSSTLRGSSVHKNHNSIFIYYRVIALCYFSLSGAQRVIALCYFSLSGAQLEHYWLEFKTTSKLLKKLQSYCPLLLSHCFYFLRSITWRLMVVIQYNVIQWLSTLRGSAVHKNHNSIFANYKNVQIYCPLTLFLVRSITWKALLGIQNNFIQWSSTIRGSAVYNNHNSVQSNYRVIALVTFPLLFLVQSITWNLLVGIQYKCIQWSSILRESAVHRNHNSFMTHSFVSFSCPVHNWKAIF
jgi:hypothetical protein